MTAAWLAAALLAAVVPDRLTPLRGLPVQAVEVVVPAGNDAAELRRLIDIAPGTLLEPADVQAGIKRLFVLGRFSQVEAQAQRLGDAVALRFVAAPMARVEAVDIVGVHAMSGGALRDALQVVPGDEVDSRTVAQVRERALAALSQWGFPQADVEVARRDLTDQGAVTLELRVREGPPRRLVALHITGSPRLPRALLLGGMWTRPGRVLAQPRLRWDIVAMRQALIEHGFLQARIGAPRIGGDREHAVVTLPVDAGDRTDIVFRGNAAVADADLRALWPDASGAVSATNLRIMRQRIVALYVRRGFPQARVRLVGAADRRAHQRRYAYLIAEGRPVRVAALSFPGATALPQELLRRQVTALLHRELDADALFAPLSAADAQALGAPARPAPPPPPVTVPVGERWVPELYAEAAEQIAAAYHDLGYLEAEVATPRAVAAATPHARGLCAGAAPGRPACPVAVEVAVHEGPQSFIASIAFAGNQARPSAALLQVVADATARHPLTGALQPGSPLSGAAIEDGRIALIRDYRDQGYLFVQAFAQVEPQVSGLWAAVRYTLEEGPQVRVGHMLTRGNHHTREGVIKSRIAMRSGDVYRLDQAVADQRSVNALGVFSQVRVRMVDEERAEPRKDVVTDVVERPRQPVELALGISTANGPRLRLTYSHLNVAGTATAFTASLKLNRQVFFALFGDFGPGLQARYSAYHGSEQLTRALEREVRVGLRAPPIRALPLDPLLRLDLVDSRVNAVRYSFDGEALIAGADLRAPHGLKGTLEGSIGLTNLECDVNIDPLCNQTIDVRRLQSRPIDVGQLWTLKGGPLVLWDLRDSPLDPHAGALLSLRYTYAVGGAEPHPHGGFEPFAFAKYEAAASGYVPLGGVVLALAARAGTVQLVRSQVPINERFFLGGRDTLRGYVESTLIPQDACVGSGARPPHCAELISPGVGGPPLSRGGNSFLVLKSELRLPLTAALSFDLFVDAGNLWIDPFDERLALRLGTGIGLRYATPVGALAVDLGVNPSPRPAYGEPWAQLHFSIGAF